MQPSKYIYYELKNILGADFVYNNTKKLEKYSQDKTENLRFLPEIVVLPSTVEQVSQIMKLCFKEKIPVTVRGAGTGLAGGALAVCGGVLLSMERFDKIIKIDERNLQVWTEPGVITEILQAAVQEKGLYYPPDPASKGSSFIGGNIATNAGGPRAVKYGVVKDYVLNLEVVLANGDVIWTGANTLKNSTGYNLSQLIVGSEGTLGIITKAVLKLIPYPKHSLLLLASFSSSHKACEAVSAVFRAGITPSCMEFMERQAIDLAVHYLKDFSIQIDDSTQAQLLIEVDGNHLESLYADCEKIQTVLENFDCTNILFADDEATKNSLWKLRRNLNQAVKYHSNAKKADTVVPRAELATLLKGIHDICAQHQLSSANYGHAGDGNLHVSLLQESMPDEIWERIAPQVIRQIFVLVKSLHGTISGEHGIGWIQKEYMDIVFKPEELELMRQIKKAFDSNYILNPNKIID